MQRQPVESSMLRSAGYDPAREILELEFTSGRIYRYFGVPEDIFADLLSAESKGRYFLDQIDDLFPYLQVRSTRSRRS
ncbi:MAG: KTSC domain-containing protein [Chloroflexia bacterium]|nr:KTSC domain-containing protein [Chloroflexia bacterium]